uniref:G_PROTEIN_RECEP_F1_2 domain-containing protein n=1 Tax=Parastrongyloides trichosuri TaxID=131310 RepID=A0A0N4ZLQ2_PARTI
MLNPLFFSSVKESYFNCIVEGKSLEDAKPNENFFFMSYIFLITGIIFIIVYIPCIAVMFKPEFLNTSCYKIMVFLAIIDVLTVLVNSVATGLFSIIDVRYCKNSYLILITGTFGLALWCATCFTTVLLAVNRVLDIRKSKFSYILFNGKKTIYWLLLATLYSLYFAIATNPLCFSADKMTWFFNPFMDYNFDTTELKYVDYGNISHTVNNFLIVILLVICYVIMFFSLYEESKRANVTNSTNKVMMRVQIQVFIICFFVFAAAALYVYMQFFVVSTIMTIVAQMLWSFAQGVGGFIYFIFNQKIRKAVFKMAFGNKNTQVISVSTTRRAKHDSK